MMIKYLSTRNGREWNFIMFKNYLFNRNGPEWKKIRSVLDKQMMKPSHVTTYVSKIYDINADFLCRLRRMRRDDMSVSDMDMELFNWSLESE